jgi:hypothetical protein
VTPMSYRFIECLLHDNDILTSVSGFGILYVEESRPCLTSDWVGPSEVMLCFSLFQHFRQALSDSNKCSLTKAQSK